MKRLLTALLLFIFNGVAAASPATPEVVRYDRYLRSFMGSHYR